MATVRRFQYNPSTPVKVLLNRVTSPIAPDTIHLEVFQFLPGIGIRWATRQLTYLTTDAAPEAASMRHWALEALFRVTLEGHGLWDEGQGLERQLMVQLNCRRVPSVASWGIIRLELVGSRHDELLVIEQPDLEDHHAGLFPILRSAIRADGKWRRRPV